MANKLLDRHTRLTKEIETLEAAIAEASKGIDAKEQKFNFQQWKDKWNKSKSASLKKVLNENRIGKGEAVSTGGPVRGILSIGERWRDPKKLLKLLKEREAFLAKNLGQKYARDVDDIYGLTGGGPLRSKLLMRDRANPFYVREFDKDIFWKEKELEVQAQNKFKAQNRDTWHETYDDPYKGWRSLLPETHSNKPGSPNAKPNNPLLKGNRDNVTNGDSPSTTTTATGSTSTNNNRNQLRSGIYDVRGGGGFYGRNANILTADGRSTSLSINTSNKRWGNADPGEMLGVMPKKLRQQYDREVLKIGS